MLRHTRAHLLVPIMGPTIYVLKQVIVHVVGFLGYPQPGGGVHPPIPSEGGLGEVLWQLD